MQLLIGPRAPNPRRVQMFLAEKGITTIPEVPVDLNTQQHRSDEHRARSPFAKVPVLQLDDGRFLSETRAICTWIEGHFPDTPNLMGRDADERAFIEMADRQAEWYLLLPIAQVIRHTHLGLAPLEQPQFPDYGRAQAAKLPGLLAPFEQRLAGQPFLAGDRFTIADITAFVALEFARGLLKQRPIDLGCPHLQAWRDRMAERPSARAGQSR